MARFRLGRTAAHTAGRVLHLLRSSRSPARGRPAPPGSPRPAGAPDVEYRPFDDDRPDPGEIVWAWVPFEEDDGRGKDRPVLIIGRRGEDLLGLMLTSRDHDRDAADEARHGRSWTDIGTGAWDPRGRASEVRLDRLLVLDPGTVRREGAALDRSRFDRVVAEARRVQGW
ncbi:MULTISPECIES: type II toxin-antitoxin system PemK/MazF family toxin [unclassified Blastococcus]